MPADPYQLPEILYVDPETTDMTGREGFGIALAGSTDLRNEWIFSKDTCAFLGTSRASMRSSAAAWNT
jgi:hypothetical protein